MLLVQDAILADFSSDSPEAVKTAVNEGNGRWGNTYMYAMVVFCSACTSMADLYYEGSVRTELAIH